MTELIGRELDAEVERALFVPVQHLAAQYMEGVSEGGDDGWDGFFCPRCHTDEAQYNLPCAKHYSSDARDCAVMEQEIERRGLTKEYAQLVFELEMGGDAGIDEDRDGYVTVYSRSSSIPIEAIIWRLLTAPLVTRCRAAVKVCSQK